MLFRSSGKMGWALARAARRRGARVVLVSGPTALPVPRGVEVRRVETAEEMAACATEAVASATVAIAAAAVADYRPVRRAGDKEAKRAGASTLELETTPDVVASLPRHDGLIVVGFAAETRDVAERARGKLVRKRLDLVVANDVAAADAGFDVDTNRVTLIDAAGATDLPLLEKDAVADAILDRLGELRRTRPLAEPNLARARGKRRAG